MLSSPGDSQLQRALLANGHRFAVAHSGGQTAATSPTKWWCAPMGHTGKLSRGFFFRERKDGTEDNELKVKPGWMGSWAA